MRLSDAEMLERLELEFVDMACGPTTDNQLEACRSCEEACARKGLVECVDELRARVEEKKA